MNAEQSVKRCPHCDTPLSDLAVRIGTKICVDCERKETQRENERTARETNDTLWNGSR